MGVEDSPRGLVLLVVCLSLYSLWHIVAASGKSSCWTLLSLFFSISPETCIADTSVFLFLELCCGYSVSYKHSYSSPLVPPYGWKILSKDPSGYPKTADSTEPYVYTRALCRKCVQGALPSLPPRLASALASAGRMSGRSSGHPSS